MSKVFFLPKSKELKDMEISNPSSSYPDIFILEPSALVIESRSLLDKSATIAAVLRQIQTLAGDDEELFLLYHIGSTVSLDVEFRTMAPALFSRRYSAFNSGKANYTKIIATIKNIHFASVPLTPEALIQEFFLNREVAVKVELLHQCQLPASIPALLPAALIETEEAYRYLTAFNKFKKAWADQTEDCVFMPEFIAAQKELRVALLGA
ncbi:hypothetical protein [Emticicia fontis]